ncbi:MAG: hypothetical protein LLG04_13115, partial [Parachlamydia sp.]|nr:hypothetical protein [Parachlamydia sp.]
SALDDIANGHFTHTFDELVAKLKELTPRERKELRTLFRFPNAKVPDREKLQEFLKALTQKAQASAKERFGLPDDFKLNHQSHLFKLSMKGGFGNNFQKEVLKKLRNGEINHEQAQKLVASKGTDPAKLPSNLQNVYTQARQTAAKQTADDYGLPDNWQPTEESSETASGETSATPQETVRNADGTVRVKANTPVQRKNVQTQQSQPIDPMTAPASHRDQALIQKAFNYYEGAISATSKVSAVYFTGPEQMLMGDCMATVSNALSNLRESACAIQVAEARASREISRGQNDAQEEKIRKELKDMMKAPPKQFFLFKILRVIPIVKQFADKIEQAIKLLLWAVDTILGGAINMITQAIGMEAITENPFLMLGWINEEQAKKMDMALGIIVMVAEMAVSAVLAQPELVMAQVAAMTARLSEAGASTVARVVSQTAERAIGKAVTESAATSAAKSFANAGVKVATREGIEIAAREAAQQIVPEVLQQAAKQGVKVTAKQATKQAISKSIQAQARAFVRKVFEKTKEIAKAEVKQQVKRVQNYKQTVTEGINNTVDFIQQPVKNIKKLVTKLRSGGDGVEATSKMGDGAADSAASTLNKQTDNLLKKTKNEVDDVVEQLDDEVAGEVMEESDNINEGTPPDDNLSNADEASTGEKGKTGEPDGKEPGDADGVKTKGDESSVANKKKKLNQKEKPVDKKAANEKEKKPRSPPEKAIKDTEQKADTKSKAEEAPEGDAKPEKAEGRSGGKDIDAETELKMNASKNAILTEKEMEKAEEALTEVMKKLITKRLKDQGYKIINEAERHGFKDTLKAATEGKSGFGKLADGLEAGADWVKTEVKEGVETGMKKAAEATKMNKVADEVGQQVDKVTDKLGKTKVGKVATNIAERFASSDTLIKDANKLMLRDAKDDLQHAQRKLLKASEKLMVERQQSNFRFMMDIKDYIQDTIQFASYTAQAIMYMKKADAAMKAAENQAFIQEMDSYVEMDKKAVDNLMKGMEEMAGWINDINQQESTFWKKMEIRFIAA